MFAKCGSLKGERDLGQLWRRLRARVPTELPVLSGTMSAGFFSLLLLDLQSCRENWAWYF